MASVKVTKHNLERCNSLEEVEKCEHITCDLHCNGGYGRRCEHCIIDNLFTEYKRVFTAPRKEQ